MYLLTYLRTYLFAAYNADQETLFPGYFLTSISLTCAANVVQTGESRWKFICWKSWDQWLLLPPSLSVLRHWCLIRFDILVLGLLFENITKSSATAERAHI